MKRDLWVMLERINLDGGYDRWMSMEYVRVLLFTSSDNIWKERFANERLMAAISLGRKWSLAIRQKL